MPLTAPAPLIAYLSTTGITGKLDRADLYTITLQNGQVLHYTNHDTDLIVDGVTYTHFMITRSRLKHTIGLSVDDLDILITAGATDLINGVKFLTAFRQGMFDGALLQLDYVFPPTGWTYPVTTISADYVLSNKFYGYLTISEMNRYNAQLKVKSLTDILNIKMPKNIYGPECSNTIFDPVCALNKASHTTSSAVESGSSTTSLKAILPQSSEYFDQGYVIFTSGDNEYSVRTVKSYIGGMLEGASTINLLTPLLFTPGVGDTFDIIPGCDKTYATCGTNFSNTDNFRGCPFVPVPESLLP
jgi:uncharacterized phage protein (TIGR02218 family)